MNKKKKIRQNFRTAVFARDNHKCRKCGAENVELDAHHITDRNEMPNGGYVKENGISLCDSCHIKAEVFHSSNHEQYEDGFHPNDLYVLIDSSEKYAYDASIMLINKL
jgi:hypothetical protein